jgi:Tol biopolymer transport system component
MIRQGKFTTYDGDIYVMRSDGSGRGRLTTATSNDSYPMVSPDGRTVVFVRGPAGSPTVNNLDDRAAIFVIGTNGRRLHKLTTKQGFYGSPAWSPDGRKIAFRYGDRYAIYVMNADGSAQRPVVFEDRWEYTTPRWSPDGRKIAYHSGGLFVVPLGAGKKQYLGFGSSPKWSPDGRRLVFVNRAAGCRGVWPCVLVTNADGTGRRQLTGRVGAAHDSTPVWSPDGNAIAFAREGRNAGIYVMSATGAEQRRVARVGAEPAWQPVPVK